MRTWLQVIEYEISREYFSKKNNSEIARQYKNLVEYAWSRITFFTWRLCPKFSGSASTQPHASSKYSSLFQLKASNGAQFLPSDIQQTDAVVECLPGTNTAAGRLAINKALTDTVKNASVDKRYRENINAHHQTPVRRVPFTCSSGYRYGVIRQWCRMDSYVYAPIVLIA